MKENHLRSVIKGASWRIVGTIDTIILSLIFTGSVGTALKIGGVELFTKIFLFYLHERIWFKIGLGTSQTTEQGVTIKKDKHYRSLLKGISWRAIGSLDTFWIAIVINQHAAHPTQTAFYISATEVITKVGLFWLHERIWLRLNWGAESNQSDK